MFATRPSAALPSKWVTMEVPILTKTRFMAAKSPLLAKLVSAEDIEAGGADMADEGTDRERIDVA